MTIVYYNLDDFIAHNRRPVVVDSYSKPVIFPGINYVALPGAKYHLEVLQGAGFQLEAKIREGTDICDGGVVMARILNKEGAPTGFSLMTDKVNPDTKRTRQYCIKDEELQSQGLRCLDWEERYTRASRIMRLKRRR